jgi:prepilin-type N-terminal cleavage/methylation domain-containing protein
MSHRLGRRQRGFTLLEVLVTLTVLGVGSALTLSLVSGSLGNIRKVQVRSRTIHHAETVLELALLDDSIEGPTVLQGDFEDGTRWTVEVTDFVMPDPPWVDLQRPLQLPIKALAYDVAVIGPGSAAVDFRLHTLKIVSADPRTMPAPSEP